MDTYQYEMYLEDKLYKLNNAEMYLEDLRREWVHQSKVKAPEVLMSQLGVTIEKLKETRKEYFKELEKIRFAVGVTDHKFVEKDPAPEGDFSKDDYQDQVDYDDDE